MSEEFNFFFKKNTDYHVNTENTDNFYNELVSNKKNLIMSINQNKTIFNYHLFPNIISNNLCDYIINESEKYSSKNISINNPYGWTTKRHKNYPTTDLPINKIDSLNTIIQNMVVYDIFPLIEKVYNVSKYFLACNDIFVVKYEDNKQKNLEKHIDGTPFSFNILLNHETNFEGGGTIFHKPEGDNLVLNTKGGLLLHYGKDLHSGNNIVKGKRYILVGFISYLKEFNIIYNKNNDNLNNLFNKKLIVDNNVPNNINLDFWNVNIDNEYQNKLDVLFNNNNINLENKPYLLDISKNTFTIFEKISYDLAIFHLKRMNLEIDFNRYKIEIWCKNTNKHKHNLHSDKDELLFKNNNILLIPLLSTITYINDSFYPLLITNTDGYNNEINTITTKNGVTLFFPKKMTHISFNGKKLHGVMNIYEEHNLPSVNRKAIMFNIWDSHSPTNYNSFKIDNKIDKNIDIINITRLDNVIKTKICIKEEDMIIFIKTLLWNNNNVNKIISEIYDYNKYGLIYNNNIVEFDII